MDMMDEMVLETVEGGNMYANAPNGGTVLLTVRKACLESLLGGNQQVSAEEKLRRYTLAQVVQKEGLGQLRRDEIDLIKKLAADCLSIAAYGALMQALDKMDSMEK